MRKYIWYLHVILFCFFINTSDNLWAASTSGLDTTSDDSLAPQASVEENPDTGDIMGDTLSDWFNHSPHYDGIIKKKWDIHNDLSVSFSHSAGNTRDFDIGGALLNALGYSTFVNTLEAGLDYSQSAVDVGPLSVVNQHIFIDEQLEWHFHKDFYALTSFDWHTDKPSGIDNYYSFNVGFGHFLIENDKLVLRPELSYHFSQEDQLNPATDLTLNSLLFSLRFNWNITKATSWTSEYDYILDISNGSNYRLDFNAGLNLTIYKSIYFSPEFSLKFDNNPVPGFKKYDTQTTGSLGVTF